MLEFIINLYLSKNIVVYYQSIGNLVRYSDYSLSEIENMIPYEMEIFSSILMKQLQEEKAKNARR